VRFLLIADKAQGRTLNGQRSWQGVNIIRNDYQLLGIIDVVKVHDLFDCRARLVHERQGFGEDDSERVLFDSTRYEKLSAGSLEGARLWMD